MLNFEVELAFELFGAVGEKCRQEVVQSEPGSCQALYTESGA